MVAEGEMLGGEWIDVTVFKDAFLDYVQVEAFNFIARNNVPQTDDGQQGKHRFLPDRCDSYLFQRGRDRENHDYGAGRGQGGVGRRWRCRGGDAVRHPAASVAGTSARPRSRRLGGDRPRCAGRCRGGAARTCGAGRPAG